MCRFHVKKIMKVWWGTWINILMDGKLEYIKMSIISTSIPSITLLFGHQTIIIKITEKNKEWDNSRKNCKIGSMKADLN